MNETWAQAKKILWESVSDSAPLQLILIKMKKEGKHIPTYKILFLYLFQ